MRMDRSYRRDHREDATHSALGNNAGCAMVSEKFAGDTRACFGDGGLSGFKIIPIIGGCSC